MSYLEIKIKIIENNSKGIKCIKEEEYKDALKYFQECNKHISSASA